MEPVLRFLDPDEAMRFLISRLSIRPGYVVPGIRIHEEDRSDSPMILLTIAPAREREDLYFKLLPRLFLRLLDSAPRHLSMAGFRSESFDLSEIFVGTRGRMRIVGEKNEGEEGGPKDVILFSSYKVDGTREGRILDLEGKPLELIPDSFGGRIFDALSAIMLVLRERQLARRKG